MTNNIGTVAMELIETILEEFGSDAQVTIAAIVCEVKDGDDYQIVARFTDDRDWIQAALLEQGLGAVEEVHSSEDGD